MIEIILVGAMVVAFGVSLWFDVQIIQDHEMRITRLEEIQYADEI